LSRKEEEEEDNEWKDKFKKKMNGRDKIMKR